MGLRPTTTACRPVGSTPYASRRCMMPAGVHDRNPCPPRAMAAKDDVVTPSTSLPGAIDGVVRRKVFDQRDDVGGARRGVDMVTAGIQAGGAAAVDLHPHVGVRR